MAILLIYFSCNLFSMLLLDTLYLFLVATNTNPGPGLCGVHLRVPVIFQDTVLFKCLSLFVDALFSWLGLHSFGIVLSSCSLKIFSPIKSVTSPSCVH